jgi:GxxExxY protein
MEACLFKDLSYKVMGAFFAVHSELGPGLLESAYGGALMIELRNRNLRFEKEKLYSIIYRGETAGTYMADLVVENKIIIELKSVSKLTTLMEAQLLHYLRISGLQVGYLVNFNSESLEYKRRVYSLR